MLIGDSDVVVEICIESLYLWLRRGRGDEGVSFNNKSFGGFSEVRYHDRDVTLRDVMPCGYIEDLTEQGLTRVAGGM